MIPQSDIPELIDAYLDGDLGAEALAQLKAWLDADDAHLELFAHQVFLHQQLREAIVAENAAKCLQANEDASEAATPVIFDDSSGAAGGFWTSLPALLLSVVFIVAVTGAIAYRLGKQRAVAARQDDAGASIAVAPAASGNAVAKLINVTNCRWDEARRPVSPVDGTLRAGQSLHLLEGVAKIRSELPDGSTGDFQLEGPLAMTIAEDGMPILSYGRLAAEFTFRKDPFSVGTTLGPVIVSDDASIGLKVAANEVELHVFRGRATFDVWSTVRDEVPSQLLTAEPGTSLRARIAADGQISVDYGKALENRFVTPASLAASQLLISEQYVNAIRDAKPVAYWRFEEEVDRYVRNEMSDRFHLRMGGEAVRLRSGHGTRTAEFGITAGPGYMLSDDVFDGVVDTDYTLELWAKPTCVHHGAMFSLIHWSPETTPRGQHRLYLEFCGPRPGDYKTTGFKFDLHPGRISFINCRAESFSSSSYAVRKWMHLAAVRDRGIMRLYVDGRLEATDENHQQLGPGMRAMMGQLYPPSKFVRDEVTARMYVGEIDEVALYDRPLGEDDINKHVQLARPDIGAGAERGDGF